MGRITINSQKCKGCLLCIDACPKNAIEQGNELNSKGYYPPKFSQEKNACVGCAFCAMACPDVAIEVYR